MMFSAQSNAHLNAACRTSCSSSALPAVAPYRLRQSLRSKPTPKLQRTPQATPGSGFSSSDPGRTPYNAGTDQSPDAVAKRQRERAAEAAAGNVEEGGKQLGASAGEGVADAESVLADSQEQFAKTAADAAGNPRTDRTSFEVRARQNAMSAADAAEDTRQGRQEDAARVEGAFSERTAEVSSAVADSVRSVPTAADAVRGVGGGAAGALKGIGQAGSQVSTAAEEVQRGAEGLASEVQRNTESTSQALQDRVNKASAKAEATARDLKQGTLEKKGKSLLSETTPLTTYTASSRDDIDGLKTELLAKIAGLDRGFAAGKKQMEDVKSVVDDLVAASDPVNLMPQASRLQTSAVMSPPPPPPPPPAGTPGGVTIYDGTETVAPDDMTANPIATPPAPAPTPPPVGVPTPPGTAPPRVAPPPVTAPAPPPTVPTNPSTVTPPGARVTVQPATSDAFAGSSTTRPAMSDTSYGSNMNAMGLEQEKKEQEKNEKLGGVWRLVYSSGFARRNTGGARPGVPINLFPAQFGQIYQDINTTTRRLDNVVELRRPALPVPSWAPIKPLPAEALLTLKHRLEVTAPAKVTITFTGTDVNLQGGLGGVLNTVPQFELPNLPEQLQPSRRNRSASFDVVYLDDDIRITRGDRQELRVFLRT